MAEGQSGPSYGDLAALENRLLAAINEVQRDVNRLERWTESEINRLENEMKEIGASDDRHDRAHETPDRGRFPEE
jgi:hypothetical protein